MWITNTEFGVKRVVISFLLFTFLLWFVVPISISVSLVIAYVMSIYISIVLYLLIYLGVTIRRNSFKVDDYIYEVLDQIQFLNPKNNLRELKIKGNVWYASKIYLNDREEWAYLDSIRLILENLGIKRINRLLVLGGGGCSIPYCIAKTYPSIRIDVVENNKLFIVTAWKYFLKGFDKKQINILNTDAYSFIKDNNNRYDLIIVDLFIGPYLPAKLSNSSIVKDLKRLLRKETGILIINLGINLEASFYQTIFIQKQILKTINFYVFERNTLGVYTQHPVQNSIQNLGVKIL